MITWRICTYDHKGINMVNISHSLADLLTCHKRAQENNAAIQSITSGGKLALFMCFGTFF